MNFDAMLAADEGKACSELKQKASDVTHERIFDVALVRFLAEAKKVEVIRIFEHLHRQLGMRRRQSLVEVRQSGALPHVQFRPDLRFENGTRPAMTCRLRRVELSLGCIADLGEQHDHVKPRQLVSSLLTKSAVWA